MMAVIPTAQAQTFTVLHEFTCGPDGCLPQAGLSMDRVGNYYGTASSGGASNLGTVYQLSHHNSSWIVTPLYNFKGGSDDGRNPWSRVIVGPDGALYGTTPYGGNSTCSGYYCGVVYSIAPPVTPCPVVSCQWPETVIHRFAPSPDGFYPGRGDIVFDQAGNIYGTTTGGGTDQNGVVYKLTRSNGSWTESILYNFTGGSDGGGPFAGVTFDAAGNLYGTTLGGGAYGDGTVYQLKPAGSGWTETTLHSFNPPQDGGYSVAGLINDSSGNFYGATSEGGTGGGGTIYELTPSGGSWTYSVLHSIVNPNGQGGPGANLLWSNGNLYGTMSGWADGNDPGSVFELTQSNGSWNLVYLYHFTFGDDGGIPDSSLIMDSAGNLYGTASLGDPDGGTIFQIMP